jgi:hypothetical protein
VRPEGHMPMTIKNAIFWIVYQHFGKGVASIFMVKEQWQTTSRLHSITFQKAVFSEVLPYPWFHLVHNAHSRIKKQQSSSAGLHTNMNQLFKNKFCISSTKFPLITYPKLDSIGFS